MKKLRKAMLLAACAASSMGLASCDNGKGTNNEYSAFEIITLDKRWIVTEIGKNDVLFDAKNIQYRSTGGMITFTASHDEKKYTASDYFIFEHDNKPSKALYDVEYGTKEWYELEESTRTETRSAEHTFEMTK